MRPEITSPTRGPSEIRWRVGLSPNSPQQLAGIRIEPPPSLAWAIVTIPELTAAAEPPLEPPVVRSVSQGLRLGPYARGSVVGRMPSSGVLVLPMVTKPAARNRWPRKVSTGDRNSSFLSSSIPTCSGCPASAAPRSLKRNGTPRNGPSGRSPAASSRASSKSSWMTALSCGLSASVRAIAASTSSSGDASPDRTSSACALASMLAIAVDTLEDRLEPNRERLLELADAAGCEQHSRHERRPVERVVADRERLGLSAEQHLLMRDQSG